MILLDRFFWISLLRCKKEPSSLRARENMVPACQNDHLQMQLQAPINRQKINT